MYGDLPQPPPEETPPVSRPRLFDNEKALDAAIACFWRRGFEATSVRDLAVEMGINGPSLYNAFGDKRTLFMQALERYAKGSMRERIERIEREHQPKAALRIFFRDLVERSLSDPQHLGCLIVNTALELAPHDAEIRALIASYFEEIESFFRRCLGRALAAGELAPPIRPADSARSLLGVMLGLRVAARVKPEQALLEGMVRASLAFLNYEQPSSSRNQGDA